MNRDDQHDLQDIHDRLCTQAKEMAAAIERTVNERAQEGWELMTFSVTNSAKAILVFRLPNAAQQQRKSIPEEIDNETR